ncbi:MAG TPA: ribosome biogenesis GTP-binding protein YihA/YsxC [Alphaproteobacteria bacterium]
MTGGGAPEDADAQEAARRLFAGPCAFVAGAATAASLPPARGPEVAFAGRSNVGKSSLINTLTGRGALARTSSTPGRTRQINFFDLGGRLTLVDLPGYGHARAGRGEAGAWSRLTALYLRGRQGLRRVVVLIDARRDIGEADREVMALLDEAAVSYQVVLTKIDKAPAAADAVAQVAAEIAGRPAAHPDVLATSARAETGIDALRAALAALAAPGQLG